MDDRAYSVKAAQRREEWTSKYSRDGEPDMVDYAIALEGEEGWIKLSQKITTQPPLPGKELFGHIETKTNPKSNTTFRKFQKAPKGSNPGIQSERVEYMVSMLEELTGRRPAAEEKTPLEDPFEGRGI